MALSICFMALSIALAGLPVISPVSSVVYAEDEASEPESPQTPQIKVAVSGEGLAVK